MGTGPSLKPNHHTRLGPSLLSKSSCCVASAAVAGQPTPAAAVTEVHPLSDHGPQIARCQISRGSDSFDSHPQAADPSVTT